MTRSRLLGLGAAGAGLALLAVLIGVDWLHCVMLGGVPLLVSAGRTLAGLGEDAPWPLPEGRFGDAGARREVARLSWALSAGEETVTSASVRRLRAVADGRLRSRGLDLDDPADEAACRELLGPGYGVLTAPRGVYVRYDAFRQAVGAVERLGSRRVTGVRGTRG